MRGYVDAGIAEKVRAAGGEIYAISSEPQALSLRAAKDWKLDFETVGDPHHEIADSCRERGWLDLFVNERLEFLGDGVIGLAVARALALAGREVVVAEAAEAIGTGTSSRNSEVIHAQRQTATGRW